MCGKVREIGLILHDMNAFKDKVIWITGASSGIGEELALQLADAGASIVLSSRKVDELERVKHSLKNSESHLVLPLDLGSGEDFVVQTDQVMNKYGRIDFLFNSGGLSQRSEAGETPISVDRYIMEVNFFGNVALTKAVLPHMRKQGSGHIVVTSSIAGKFGFFLRSAYSASKHALHGFYESLLLEEEKNGIRVTIVCPGKINTPISTNALTAEGVPHNLMDNNQAKGMSVQECVRQMLRGVEKNKTELLIGNKEVKAVTLKRLFPALFWKIIKKQKAT
jgi:dehydrogenase/reductase SDR family member 7B